MRIKCLVFFGLACSLTFWTSSSNDCQAQHPTTTITNSTAERFASLLDSSHQIGEDEVVVLWKLRTSFVNTFMTYSYMPAWSLMLIYDKKTKSFFGLGRSDSALSKFITKTPLETLDEASNSILLRLSKENSGHERLASYLTEMIRYQANPGSRSYALKRSSLPSEILEFFDHEAQNSETLGADFTYAQENWLSLRDRAINGRELDGVAPEIFADSSAFTKSNLMVNSIVATIAGGIFFAPLLIDFCDKRSVKKALREKANSKTN